jgi:REP element-mobilizing transposase RayT
MPRKARAEHESGVYHVYARGNRKQSMYLADADHWRYFTTLGRVTIRMQWRCLSYCMMGNHVHLLVETRIPNLGTGMQRLHGAYAQYFNRRYDLSGHLFQGRFDAKRIKTDAQFWVTAAYIANNPVVAGLCASPAEWPWSSHLSLTGAWAPSWLDTEHCLSYFDGQGGDPRQTYVDLVDALFVRRPKGDSPL